MHLGNNQAPLLLKVILEAYSTLPNMTSLYK